MSEPTVGNVWAEATPRLIAWRDAFWLRIESEDDAAGIERFDYYCIRCHRHHWKGTDIGRRHSGKQPYSFGFKLRAMRKMGR